MPLRKVHELTFLWFGLPGPLLILPGAFWAHGASTMATLGTSLLLCIVFYSVSEPSRAYFRQARVAQAVLPPGALFHSKALHGRSGSPVRQQMPSHARKRGT